MAKQKDGIVDWHKGGRQEIPDTEHGINQYANYCTKQIRESKNLIHRLETRLKWCYEKAQQMGFTVRIIEKEGNRL